MKNLIITILLITLAFNLKGQTVIEPTSSSIRSNIILVNGLFGKTKIGIGVRYKSLYHINNIIRVGWGVGIESYSSNFERNFVPISFDFVGDVFKNGRSPFYMVSVGYGFPFGENSDFAEGSKGGLMVDISLGYRSKKHSSQPFIAVGYRLQNAFYKGTDEYGNTDKDVIYKRWSLSTGILF